MKVIDLGLTYEQAAHGVQTAIKYAMETDPEYKAHEPKHMRTGVDMSKADQAGLAMLLINKGVFTLEEYCEAMRLHANQELAMREAEYPGLTFR